MRPIGLSDLDYVARPLNLLFAAPSHIAVLRALRNVAGATGREVARRAGVTPRAALETLARLEEAQIVRREAAGRAYLFRLNRRHRLVRRAIVPLLDEEAEFRAELWRWLEAKLSNPELVAGAVFGSVSRRQDRASSDLDVCLIVRRADAVERLKVQASERADELAETFGLRLAPVVFEERDFRRRYARGDSIVRNIVKDGLGFAGRELRQVVRG